MGLPVKIEDILHARAVEWERLEFKQGWNPEPVMHTLCAFANDFNNQGGGYIILGVEARDGCPVLPPQGLKQQEIDGIQQEILNIGYRLTPHYHPVVELCEIEGKLVLFLRAYGGQNRPYRAPLRYAKSCRDMAYYIRKGSSTIRVTSKSDEAELIALSNNVPYDDRWNQRASVDDLEIDLIEGHLKEAGSSLAKTARNMEFVDLARKMRIVDGPDEYLCPVNVGLMFFNSQPEQFFPGAQINVLEFPDGVGRGRIVRKSFKGPLGKQLIDTLEYLQNQILKTTQWKEKGRAKSREVWNYPYAALEELLPNAVYHRLYDDHEAVEVRIEPERLSITSYPGPDRSIKLRDLKAGKLIARRYRNRRIGEFLKEIKLAEAAGTGIPATIAAMQDNGSPFPIFDTDEDRSYFTAILPIHPAFLGGFLGGVPPINTPLQTRLELILSFCMTPRSRAEIQDLLDLRDRKHFREKYLAPLLAREFLVPTDIANPLSRNQKYQTTHQGKEALKQQPTLFDTSN